MQQELKYLKKDLLAIVKENRAKHASEYETSRAAYQKKLVKYLTKELTRAEKGKKLQSPDFHPPKRYLKDYDRSIRQLELTIATEVKLDASDFACLVMDEWSWKAAHMASNMFYADSDNDDE